MQGYNPHRIMVYNAGRTAWIVYQLQDMYMPEHHAASRRLLCLTLLVLVATVAAAGQPAPPPGQQKTREATFDLMRQALHQTLRLQFEPALAVAAKLDDDQQLPLASSLTRGIIAYFQTRWQTARASAAHATGHELLQEVIVEGQQHLAETEDPESQLFVGLAAVFDGLLQQSKGSWSSMQLFRQGRSRLEQALLTRETLTDAHLGLGLLYFAGAELPALLRPLLGGSGRQGGASEQIHHLRRAADHGRFSAELARTFLARIYELEQWYEEAIAVSQALQETFPSNGYYALIAGRSQYAYGQYAACAQTLEQLVARVEADGAVLSQPDDRFDMYYYWGLALQDIHQYDQAFGAFRGAINQDPRALKDETLWAKYYLATLYERRGQTKTAQQMYRRLLKGRKVEDLHQRVQQRLAPRR